MASTGSLLVKNPATGEIIAELAKTPLDSLPQIFAQAHIAQQAWAKLRPKDRARTLIDIRETILNHVEELLDLLHRENGKPRLEAITADVFPTVDLLTYFANQSPDILRDRDIKLKSPIHLHRKSTINHWPLGTVAVISPWNFPFFLPFGEIAMALVAGNAVVFKPSEFTPLIGLKIQELCEEAGLPKGLIHTVIGDGELGQAMIQNKPAKIFFTGSVVTGKKIMAAASEHLIPVVLELGGKDPMIVMADADLDYASSAALWGSFSNAGQMCASTERLLLHESIADEFLQKFQAKARMLRLDPKNESQSDIGAITVDKQKQIYKDQLAEARAQGLEVIAGGEFSPDGNFLTPTIVTGANIENCEIYNEETFGPMIAATRFKSVQEAIEKANHSRYGLLASVITKNLSLGQRMARQLEAGTVTINEVAFTAGLPETPWGGLKDSGFGRKHSDQGLLEFVNIRHINRPRASIFTMKSLWWYPYTPYQLETFKSCLQLYRRSWFEKLRAFPIFLWNLIQMLKNERRL